MGLLVTGGMGDRIYQSLTARNDGVQRPEFRLPIMMATNFLIPIGLLLYGWSAQAKAYWFVPILGTSLYGLGFVAALVRLSPRPFHLPPDPFLKGASLSSMKLTSPTLLFL